MKVTVFGAGYVGLVQAAVLAEVGHDVMCVDVDEAKVERLTRGEVPIYEPGLDSIITACVAEGTLRFTTDAAAAVRHAGMVFIAVGTPPDEDGSADLKYVLAVAETVAEHMVDEKVVVVKSTVPVGTSDKVKAAITARLSRLGKEHLPFHAVSNPEFLKEGSAVNDCKRPDRIIVGTDHEAAAELMKQLYAPFNRNHDRVIVMDIRSAEMTKYAANCMLATKISFMNEMANIAERMGADIEQVRKGIGSDPRIGFHFIYPGAGYGGSCFPKDVKALIQSSDGVGFEAQILKSVESVNQRQKHKLFEQLKRHFNGELAGKTIALWGLAFKPNTDDMRESSSRELMEALWAAGAKVQAYDPEAMEETQRIYGHRPDLALMGTKDACLVGADALVLCTEWKTFWNPDLDKLADTLSAKAVFDGRNLYDPQQMANHGLAYYGIGRGLSVLQPAA